MNKKNRRKCVSKTGWFVAVLVERFEYYNEDKSNPNRRCIANENICLIKAKDAEVAYKKAVELGKSTEEDEGIDDERRKGRWIFVGITELLPVYEDIEDGAEILWTEHRNKAVSTIEKMVSKKEDLQIFSEDCDE